MGKSTRLNRGIVLTLGHVKNLINAMNRTTVHFFRVLAGVFVFGGVAVAEMAGAAYLGGALDWEPSVVAGAITIEHGCGALGAVFLGLVAVRRFGASHWRGGF